MVAEVMRRIFADRAAYLADPDYSNVPVAGLTDPCYAKEVFATVDSQRASSSKVIKAGNPILAASLQAGNLAGNPCKPARPATTHFSVVVRCRHGRCQRPRGNSEWSACLRSRLQGFPASCRVAATRKMDFRLMTLLDDARCSPRSKLLLA